MFKKYLFKLFEIIPYIYILSIFINSKLNMKLGYLILIVAIIKIIMNKEIIKKINKKVYGTYCMIFILGIIWNYFGSNTDGIGKFINENGKFVYGVSLIILLVSQEKIMKKFNYTIFLGTNILGYFIINHRNMLIEGDYSRQRPILMMGAIYVLIYSLEKILKKEYKYVILIIFPVIGLIKSNSRMAGVVLILLSIVYILYKVIENKKNIKFFVIISLILILGIKALPTNYKNRLKTSFHTKNNVSNEDRIVMWNAGLNIWNKNKIFGIGNDAKDAFPLVQEYVDKNVKDERLRNEFLSYKRFARLHNMYLDFFVQNGILGFIYLYFFFWIIPKEVIIKNKWQLKENLPCIFALLSFFLYGITWSLWSDYSIVNTAFQCFLAIGLVDKSKEVEIKL